MLLSYKNFKLLLENSEKPIKDEYWEQDYSGKLVKKINWLLNDKLHNEDGPASIEYYVDSNQPYVIHYYQFGKAHREDGPATILFYMSGSVYVDVWKKNGIIFKNEKDEPAAIEYYESGEIRDERFFKNGVIHREVGPAWKEYNIEGEVIKELFFLNGNKIERLDFWQRTPLSKEEILTLLNSEELSYEEKAALSKNPNFEDDRDEWLLGGW